jgi:hypothetical protein
VRYGCHRIMCCWQRLTFEFTDVCVGFHIVAALGRAEFAQCFETRYGVTNEAGKSNPKTTA